MSDNWNIDNHFRTDEIKTSANKVFMKAISLFVISFLVSSSLIAKQIKEPRLEVGLNAGGFYSYPKYSYDEQFTQTNTVNNTRVNTFSSNHCLNFTYQLNRNQNVGFGICLADYTWSWQAQSKLNSSTGLISGFEYTTYHFLGLELTYQHKIAPFNLFLEGGIKIINSALIVPEDTMYDNAIDPNHIPKYQYVSLPMTINKGIYLLPFLAIYQKFKLASRLHLNLKLGYQQGLKPFLEHQTLIRNTETSEEGIFTAKINGTSLFSQIGIGYKF